MNSLQRIGPIVYKMADPATRRNAHGRVRGAHSLAHNGTTHGPDGKQHERSKLHSSLLDRSSTKSCLTASMQEGPPTKNAHS